jgi:DNA-binding MarR family transcriptional regulator
MKPKDMDIDEILKHYLPRALTEDMDEAGDAVLKNIRKMRFQPESPVAENVPKAPKAEWLNNFHVAVLMAVEQLQGQGRPVTITLRMEELLEERIVSGSAVFLVLLGMERMGLVSSSPIDPEKPEALDQRYFELTAAGRETLATALAAQKDVTDPLEGFA